MTASDIFIHIKSIFAIFLDNSLTSININSKPNTFSQSTPVIRLYILDFLVQNGCACQYWQRGAKWLVSGACHHHYSIRLNSQRGSPFLGNEIPKLIIFTRNIWSKIVLNTNLALGKRLLLNKAWNAKAHVDFAQRKSEITRSMGWLSTIFT